MQNKENKVYQITTEKQLNAILQLNLITIVDFSARWCGPCQKINPLYHDLPKKYYDFVFLSVDIEEAEELSKLFHIKSLPTFILMDKKGEFDRILGAKFDKLIETLNIYYGRRGRIK